MTRWYKTTALRRGDSPSGCIFTPCLSKTVALLIVRREAPSPGAGLQEVRSVSLSSTGPYIRVLTQVGRLFALWNVPTIMISCLFVMKMPRRAKQNVKLFAEPLPPNELTLGSTDEGGSSQPPEVPTTSPVGPLLGLHGSQVSQMDSSTQVTYQGQAKDFRQVSATVVNIAQTIRQKSPLASVNAF